MPSGERHLVVDANILVRAVLGRQAASLLIAYAEEVSFLAPEVAFTDAERHVRAILSDRGLTAAEANRAMATVLHRPQPLVRPVAPHVYAHQEAHSRERLRGRDESDWPYVALALMLDCPAR